MLSLLREWDSNPRPSAYETDELTTATISHSKAHECEL